MKMPESVKVGPYTYAIERHEKVLNESNEALYGDIAFGPQVIRIRSELSGDRAATILFHEALHGISELVYADLSEKQVLRIVPALYAFLRDNHLLREDAAPLSSAEKERLLDRAREASQEGA